MTSAPRRRSEPSEPSDTRPSSKAIFRVRQLADAVGGRVIGDESVECVAALPLQEARADSLTMVDDKSRIAVAVAAGAAAVLVQQPLEGCQIPQIAVENPHAAFEHIVRIYRPSPVSCRYGISPGAHVDPTAVIGDACSVHSGASIGAAVRIGDGCTIHAGAVVMDGCTLGDDVTLYPSVVLYPETVVGDRVTIHAGTVIGAHGFGYRTVAGRHQPTAQVGYVEIEADVEIGACVTIDRGSFGATRIGEGTKIDNQVMIGHNCQIGRHNLLCSQVGIAGSCRTGDYVVLAGQVGLADHLSIGDNVVVGAQAGVMDDLSKPGQYLGSPAQPLREQMQVFAALRKLPELRRTVKQLAGRLASSEHADEADTDSRDQKAA